MQLCIGVLQYNGVFEYNGVFKYKRKQKTSGETRRNKSKSGQFIT
jgi:hypothetical protein